MSVQASLPYPLTGQLITSTPSPFPRKNSSTSNTLPSAWMHQLSGSGIGLFRMGPRSNGTAVSLTNAHMPFRGAKAAYVHLSGLRLSHYFAPQPKEAYATSAQRPPYRYSERYHPQRYSRGQISPTRLNAENPVVTAA